MRIKIVLDGIHVFIYGIRGLHGEVESDVYEYG